MTVKDLKELLTKIPDDREVLVADYTVDYRNRDAIIYSYDEPSMNTFSLYDGKLLIKGYNDKTYVDFRRRIINSSDIENKSIPLK